ncbi:TPA: hypothetical protein ACX6S1_002040 [Photobacterium damselae]
MKKIGLLLALLSINSYAQDYVLTESNQGDFYTFEKSNNTTSDNNYSLEKKETDEGIIFLFKQKNPQKPEIPNYWYASEKINSSSSDEAKTLCSHITLGGITWRSPTTIEVQNAISQLDNDFVTAMESLGDNNYIARGYINGGNYIYSNKNHKGWVKTPNEQTLTGTYPTLCVRD